MFTSDSYQILETLYQGAKTVILRAIQSTVLVKDRHESVKDRHESEKSDQQSVILKVLNLEYPNVTDIAKFKHEYEIIKNLNLSGIVNPYRLETYQNTYAIVLEDCQGKALNNLGQISDLKLFLQLAIQLATTLGELHQHQIIHKDIKPQNIIINSDHTLVKITDFSIASKLSKQTQKISNPDLLEGTLAYMSPEQTGRMNRSIDYRTDFYSLGVTFYEMLTGTLPFRGEDPMELVHCHIAQAPIPPQELNPAIPDTLNEIILKLMAKTAN